MIVASDPFLTSSRASVRGAGGAKHIAWSLAPVISRGWRPDQLWATTPRTPIAEPDFMPVASSKVRSRPTCRSTGQTKFELTINLTDRKTLNPTVPAKLLVTADEVIE